MHIIKTKAYWGGFFCPNVDSQKFPIGAFNQIRALIVGPTDNQHPTEDTT